MNKPLTSNDTISPQQRRQCSRCGAYCHNDDRVCWFCKREFSQPVAPPLRAGQFSLAALLGVMTVVGIALGIFLLSPALAVVIGVFSVAALMRLAVVESLATASGARNVPAPFAFRLMVSLVLVVLAAVVAMVTFVVGCFASAMLETQPASRPIGDFPLWPIGLGFVLGLIFAGLFLWATRHVTMTD